MRKYEKNTKSWKLYQIPKNSEVGQRIGVVSAMDHDSGIDGVIRYEIQGSAARYLNIDSSTGQIMLSDKLHYRYEEKTISS